MPKYYVEYTVRANEYTAHKAKVVTAASLDDVKVTLPNKEMFTLPEHYEIEEEDGPFKGMRCHVTHTFYEWAEPTKDFMWNWNDARIIEWYSSNLTPGRIKYVEPYEPDPNKRAWKRFMRHLDFVHELGLRLLLAMIIAVDDCYNRRKR